MNRETYTRIARELNATKVKRDAYIADFIAPIKKKLEETVSNLKSKAAQRAFTRYGTKSRNRTMTLSTYMTSLPYASSSMLHPRRKKASAG